MKRIILLALLAVIGWIAWGKYEDRARAQREAELERQPVKKKVVLPPARKPGEPEVSFFTCDPARTTCSQLSSCEEARYYIRTCPGFNSGVFGEQGSCEAQWCKK